MTRPGSAGWVRHGRHNAVRRAGTPPLAWPLGPIAHRGLHDLAAGRIENGPGAIAAAAEAGFGVEIDLQVSADGVAMVHHDATLDRLTGTTGPVAAKDAAALRTLTYAATGERLIDLETCLEIIAGRVPLYVEFKSAFDGNRAIEQAAAPVIARHLASCDAPLAVMSFDPASMRAAQELLPQVPRGLVTGPFAPRAWMPEAGGLRDRHAYRAIATASELGLAFVNHDIGDLGSPLLRAVRRAAFEATGRPLPLLTWTVRSQARARAVSRRVDAIVFEGFQPDP